MTQGFTKVSLPYGHQTVDIKVPSDNLVAVASPKEVEPQADVITQVREALRAPIGAEPFSKTLKGGEKLLILIDAAR